MFKVKYPLMDESGNDGGSGGSGDTDVQALVKKAVEEATSAMSKKNSELLDELKKSKEHAKKFEGLDLEKLQNLQKHMEESEEAKLIADGKFDEVFNNRFQRVKEDYDTKLSASTKRADENDEKANKYLNLYSQERIRNNAIRAAEKAGVMPEAIDDVVDKVMHRFNLDDKGNLEARDESGSLVMSKDGKSVLQPGEYISETIKVKYPYYWPSSRGGGFGGGSGGGTGAGADINDNQLVDAAKSKNMSEFRRLRSKKG